MRTWKFAFEINWPLKVRQNRNDFFKPTFPPKNEQLNSILLLWDLFLFVYWRKSKTPKRHFENNWPLVGWNLCRTGFPADYHTKVRSIDKSFQLKVLQTFFSHIKIHLEESSIKKYYISWSHNMFSRIFRLRIYKFFPPNINLYLFWFFQMLKTEKKKPFGTNKYFFFFFNREKYW